MKNKAGISRLFSAFLNSLSGLKIALKKEAAFRQDCVLIVLAFCSLFIVEISKQELLFLIFASAILLITELLNSAIEWSVDLSTLEIHPLAKAAKDLASAAVFIALLLFITVYIFVVT